MTARVHKVDTRRAQAAITALRTALEADPSLRERTAQFLSGNLPAGKATRRTGLARVKRALRACGYRIDRLPPTTDLAVVPILAGFNDRLTDPARVHHIYTGFRVRRAELRAAERYIDEHGAEWFDHWLADVEADQLVNGGAL